MAQDVSTQGSINPGMDTGRARSHEEDFLDVIQQIGHSSLLSCYGGRTQAAPSAVAPNNIITYSINLQMKISNLYVNK
jgi:hypothetical protein